MNLKEFEKLIREDIKKNIKQDPKTIEDLIGRTIDSIDSNAGK